MDYSMQLVYETEGKRGGDIRGWHGEQAKQEAERQQYEEYMAAANAAQQKEIKS